MGSDRYAETFRKLTQQDEIAFVPFTVLGDPDPDTSLAILEAFAEGGADILELGIPFSDPVADGPAIQEADGRALAAGVTPAIALDVVARFRESYPDIPVGLLVYANLVYAPTPERFYARAAAAGVDSVLIADVPLEESRPFRHAASAAGVGYVSLAAPTSDDGRVEALKLARGPYLYVVSRVGVTGQDEILADSAESVLRKLKRKSDVPLLLGFGISEPSHVRAARAAGANGAISGSAIVSIINRHIGDRPQSLTPSALRKLLDEVRSFVRQMKAATLP